MFIGIFSSFGLVSRDGVLGSRITGLFPLYIPNLSNKASLFDTFCVSSFDVVIEFNFMELGFVVIGDILDRNAHPIVIKFRSKSSIICIVFI